MYTQTYVNNLHMQVQSDKAQSDIAVAISMPKQIAQHAQAASHTHTHTHANTHTHATHTHTHNVCIYI